MQKEILTLIKCNNNAVSLINELCMFTFNFWRNKFSVRTIQPVKRLIILAVINALVKLDDSRR